MEPVSVHRVEFTAGAAHERARRGLLLLVAVVSSSWLLRAALLWSRTAPLGAETFLRVTDALVVLNGLVCLLHAIGWSLVAGKPDAAEGAIATTLRRALVLAGWTWAVLFTLDIAALEWLHVDVMRSVRVLDVAGSLMLYGLTLVQCGRMLARTGAVPAWVVSLPRVAFLLLTVAAYVSLLDVNAAIGAHTLLHAIGCGGLVLCLLVTRRALAPGEAHTALSLRAESFGAGLLAVAMLWGGVPFVRAACEDAALWTRVKLGDGLVVARLPPPYEGVRYGFDLRTDEQVAALGSALDVDAADQFGVVNGARYGIVTADIPYGDVDEKALWTRTVNATLRHLGLDELPLRDVRFSDDQTQVIVLGPHPAVIVTHMSMTRIAVAYVVRPVTEAHAIGDIWAEPETASFLRSVSLVSRGGRRTPLLSDAQWAAIAHP